MRTAWDKRLHFWTSVGINVQALCRLVSCVTLCNCVNYSWEWPLISDDQAALWKSKIQGSIVVRIIGCWLQHTSLYMQTTCLHQAEVYSTVGTVNSVMYGCHTMLDFILSCCIDFRGVSDDLASWEIRKLDFWLLIECTIRSVLADTLR